MFSRFPMDMLYMEGTALDDVADVVPDDAVVVVVCLGKNQLHPKAFVPVGINRAKARTRIHENILTKCLSVMPKAPNTSLVFIHYSVNLEPC